MRAFLLRTRGVVRYLRPDHNPLRRPLDRAHGLVVTGFVALFLMLAPALAVPASVWVYGAGLRAERLEAVTHQRVDGVIRRVSASSGRVGAGVEEDAQVVYHDPAGAVRTTMVPAGKHDHPGRHRAVWVGTDGRATTAPRTRSQTVTETITAAIGVVLVLATALTLCCAGITRRLDRRRLALWEREWMDVSPRWTGRI